MNWYRVELNMSGCLVSINQIEPAQIRYRRRGATYFVQARHEPKALVEAFRRFDYEYPGKRFRHIGPVTGLAPLPMPVHTAVVGQSSAADASPPSSSLETRRALLEEARERFMASTMGNFGKWLNDEIAAATARTPVKLSLVGNGRG